MPDAHRIRRADFRRETYKVTIEAKHLTGGDGDSPVPENLQEKIEHQRVRFLDFVKEVIFPTKLSLEPL